MKLNSCQFEPSAHRKLRLRAAWLQGVGLLVILLVTVFPVTGLPSGGASRVGAAERPNVLIAVSDDQSFPHASAYDSNGSLTIQTPGFDEVARRGMLFNNAFTPAPGCSPMRAAFLTGRYIWQIEEAGTHASSFPSHLEVFPDQLESAGYRVGFTGKGWSPGNYKVSGRDRNPAGPSYAKARAKAPEGISANDYATNFDLFLDETAKKADTNSQPFCFWYGGHEPHRTFKKGIGIEAGKDPSQVAVPEFLPDSPEIRSDLLDYYTEIEWFDRHLVRMLRSLESRGLLENTLVIVTSDNGMSFPRAKANLYEFGIHMPLAIAWPAKFSGEQVTDELVNLIDVTATIYDACNVSSSREAGESWLEGKSLLPLLAGEAYASNEAVFSGRERHSSSRFNSLSYPCRCVRTKDYLYIRNFKPERWPAGTPQKYARVAYGEADEPVSATLDRPHGGYHDIDGCPTLTWMIANREREGVQDLFAASVAKRPAEELFFVTEDPSCLNNLVSLSEHQVALERCRKLLGDELRQTGDLRQIDPKAGDVWETYPRYSSLRWFPEPEWASDDPGSVPVQPWLEEKRPRAK